MGFWDGITGDEQDANLQGFETIPDDTKANAMIQRIDEDNHGDLDKPWFYKIQWRITDGPYRNRVVFQKLHVNDEVDAKRKRAKNMLMRLYKIYSLEVPQSIPTKMDLARITGKYYGIVIKVWQSDKGEGNWVSSVNDLHTTITVPVSGEKLSGEKLNDDIPF